MISSLIQYRAGASRFMKKIAAIRDAVFDPDGRRRILDLYEYAINPARILSPNDFYPDLLRFVGTETNTPHIILRQQAEFDSDRLIVRATFNIDQATADQVTSVYKTSSPMAEKLIAVGGSYYASDLTIEPNIADRQRTFLLGLGLRSAIYTPIFHDSELQVMIAYFRRERNGFGSLERVYF